MNMKLYIPTTLLISLFAIQGCGEDKKNPVSGEQNSSGTETSSGQMISSTKGFSSSSAPELPATMSGTLLGYCSQKLDQDLKGSFCNEIWIEKKVSVDTVDLILSTYASSLEAICGIGATFTPKAACSQSNILLACQYKAPQANGAGAPSTISRIFTLAEDEEAVLAYTAYHNFLETSQGSPCLNSKTIPQDVIVDHREKFASGNGCQITNLVGYGRACMQATGAGVAQIICDSYKAEGLTTELVENCPTSGIILTCEDVSANINFYEKAKAPKNCSDIQ